MKLKYHQITFRAFNHKRRRIRKKYFNINKNDNATKIIENEKEKIKLQKMKKKNKTDRKIQKLSISERENPRGFSPWDESELFC